MKLNRSTRRMFLQGSGGALVSIPFLTSLLPREAWAQSTGNPIRRFISIRSSYEMGHNSCWLPNDGSNIYNLPQPTNVVAGVNGHHNVRWQNLRDFAPTNSSVLAPFYGSLASPYLESMNILRGLDFIGGGVGHSWAVKFGGIEADLPQEMKRLQTMDQIINANKTFNPLGRSPVLVETTSSSQIKLANGTIVNAPRYDRHFLNIYNGLFGNGSFPESGQTALLNPKGDVLNRVIGDYNRINNSKNISSSDKLILQNAMDKFSDVQKSLVAVSANSCQYKNFYSTSPYKNSEMLDITKKEEYKFFADLITLSIICDTTRTFGLHNFLNENVYDGVAFDHQITSHETFGQVGGKFNWQRMNQRQKLAFDHLTMPLVQNLSESIDPTNGKSYLYNSLVHHTTESGQVHGSGSQPAILFGNAGGNITSGKYIDYSDRSKGAFEGADLYNRTPGDSKFSNNWRGVHYNRFLITIMQAMGVTPAEYEDNAINQQFLNRTDYGSLNANISSPLGGYGHVWLETPVVNRWDYKGLMEHIASYDLKQYKYKLPIL